MEVTITLPSGGTVTCGSDDPYHPDVLRDLAGAAACNLIADLAATLNPPE